MKKFTKFPKSFFQVLHTTDHSQLAAMTLEPGDSTGGPNNLHQDADQWLFVLDGQGEATINDKQVAFNQGDLLLINAGDTHEIKNSSNQPLHTFSIYSSPEY